MPPNNISYQQDSYSSCPLACLYSILPLSGHHLPSLLVSAAWPFPEPNTKAPKILQIWLFSWPFDAPVSPFGSGTSLFTGSTCTCKLQISAECNERFEAAVRGAWLLLPVTSLQSRKQSLIPAREKRCPCCLEINTKSFIGTSDLSFGDSQSLECLVNHATSPSPVCPPDSRSREVLGCYQCPRPQGLTYVKTEV